MLRLLLIIMFLCGCVETQKFAETPVFSPHQWVEWDDLDAESDKLTERINSCWWDTAEAYLVGAVSEERYWEYYYKRLRDAEGYIFEGNVSLVIALQAPEYFNKVRENYKLADIVLTEVRQEIDKVDIEGMEIPLPEEEKPENPYDYYTPDKKRVKI